MEVVEVVGIVYVKSRFVVLPANVTTYLSLLNSC